MLPRKVLWSDVIEGGRATLIIGKPGIGKTELSKNCVKHFPNTVVCATKKILYRRWYDIPCTWSPKMLFTPMSTYARKKLDNKCLIIEDLPIWTGNETVQNNLISILAGRRIEYNCLVVATSQFLAAVKPEFLTMFDIIVMMQGSHQALKLQGLFPKKVCLGIHLRREGLSEREYFVIDQLTCKASDIISNNNPLPLLKAVAYGIQEGEILEKSSREALRRKVDVKGIEIVYDYTPLRATTKLEALKQFVLRHPNITNRSLAEKLQTTENSISSMMALLRSRGELPRTPRWMWKKEKPISAEEVEIPGDEIGEL